MGRAVMMLMALALLACGADTTTTDGGLLDAATDDGGQQPGDTSVADWLAGHPDCETAWELWSAWGERCEQPVKCDLMEWAFYAQRGLVEDSPLSCADQVLQAQGGDAPCTYYPPTAAPMWVHYCDPRFF